MSFGSGATMSHELDEEWLALRHRVHTTVEAAARLQISMPTMMRMIRSGLIPARKVGRRWKIPGDWLVDTLRQSK